MQSLDLFLPSDMYKKIKKYCKRSGKSFDSIMEMELEKIIKEFKDNPEKFLDRFNELENKYQVEYKIN